MGCINSSTTKGLNELRSRSAVGGAGLESIGLGAFYDNVYRVRAVRLLSEGTADQNGFLELTPREIIFVPLSDNDYPTSMIWNLQHLRRYGASGDTFSFEAGRRCMTGAGIFTFQLEEAEVLYRLFQRYINSVGLHTEEVQHLQTEHAGNALARMHVNTNNYLHPNLAQNTAAAAAAAATCDNNTAEAPDSPSNNSNANEAVLFAHNSGYTRSSAPVEQFSAANIYSERPLSACNEQNNNINSFVGMNDQSELSICGESGTASAFSTISRKLLITRSSQDNTTNNSQAMTPTTPLRLYANVDHFADIPLSNNSDSCYENVCGSDFPLLFPPITPVAGGVPTVVGGSNPTTPGANSTANVSNTLTRMASIADPESMSLGSGGEAGASLVNYIVLDLDQPRSPVTPFGSEFSISAANTEPDETALTTTTTMMTTTTMTTISTTTTATTTAPACNATSFAMTTTTTNSHLEKSVAEEQQLDYSTIDFVKTWALIESSTDGVNFDVDPDPDTAEEELRITRHSKCVRKAYSIRSHKLSSAHKCH